jgi:hypothetical protein
MEKLKLKSVSVHVAEYPAGHGLMPSVQKLLYGIDDAGAVWECIATRTAQGVTERWRPLAMDVQEA